MCDLIHETDLLFIAENANIYDSENNILIGLTLKVYFAYGNTLAIKYTKYYCGNTIAFAPIFFLKQQPLQIRITSILDQFKVSHSNCDDIAELHDEIIKICKNRGIK